MAELTTNNGAGQGGSTPKNAARGLVCAGCGHLRLKVVYTRPAPNERIVRRRECRRCGQRITTWEYRIGQLQMRNELPAIGGALTTQPCNATSDQ